MNNKQWRAIKNLEEAMELISEVGLALAGIDDHLMVFSRKQYDEVSTKGKHQLGPTEVINELDYYSVICPYIDSGGT